jgi:hypothetical protein
VIGIRIRMFLGLPDPDPLVIGTDPDLTPALYGTFPFSHKCVERTEIMLAKENFNTKYQQKIKFLRLKIMWLWVSYKKKIEIFFYFLK